MLSNKLRVIRPLLTSSLRYPKFRYGRVEVGHYARFFGTVNFNLADIGEGIAEVELLRWHKKPGDPIEEMEGICEVQSDKAAVEITSRYSGTLKELKHNVGDFIKIGDVLVTIETDEAIEEDKTVDESFAPPTSEKKKPLKAASPSSNEINAVPAARRLARELGIDLADIGGNRITKADVESHYAKISQQNASPSGSKQTTPMTPISSQEDREVPIKGFARAMVKSMTETAKVPHLNIGDEFDVTDLINARNKLKVVAEKERGSKLTITPLIMKAMSLALKTVPSMNSRLLDGSKYLQYGAHNISVAIDTPNGLVVPNIKNVQNLTVLQIQAELQRLQALALGNKLGAEDLSGGTVALSNVGVIGGTYVKALLFDSQALIVGVGRTQCLPRFDDFKNVVPRNVMHFGFSADHRHCDGATTARFIAEMKKYVEDPTLMLLDLN